jgi:YHS domain-containing protein
MNCSSRIVALFASVVVGGVIALASAQMSGMPGMSGSKSAGLTKDSSTATETPHKKILALQTTCPVTGDPINKKLYIDYKGKRIYVCCASCINDVKKDPEKYIKKLESMGQGVETINVKSIKESKHAKADTLTAPESGYWTCPMHPEIHRSAQGQCPICGMNLVFTKAATGAK